MALGQVLSYFKWKKYRRRPLHSSMRRIWNVVTPYMKKLPRALSAVPSGVYSAPPEPTDSVDQDGWFLYLHKPPPNRSRRVRPGAPVHRRRTPGELRARHSVRGKRTPSRKALGSGPRRSSNNATASSSKDMTPTCTTPSRTRTRREFLAPISSLSSVSEESIVDATPSATASPSTPSFFTKESFDITTPRRLECTATPESDDMYDSTAHSESSRSSQSPEPDISLSDLAKNPVFLRPKKSKQKLVEAEAPTKKKGKTHGMLSDLDDIHMAQLNDQYSWTMSLEEEIPQVGRGEREAPDFEKAKHEKHQRAMTAQSADYQRAVKGRRDPSQGVEVRARERKMKRPAKSNRSRRKEESLDLDKHSRSYENEKESQAIVRRSRRARSPESIPRELQLDGLVPDVVMSANRASITISRAPMEVVIIFLSEDDEVQGYSQIYPQLQPGEMMNIEMEMPMNASSSRLEPHDDDVAYFMAYESFWRKIYSHSVSRPLYFSDFIWPIPDDIDEVEIITPELMIKFLCHPLYPGREEMGAVERIEQELIKYQPDKFTDEAMIAKLVPDHVEPIQITAWHIFEVLTSLREDLMS